MSIRNFPARILAPRSVALAFVAAGLLACSNDDNSKPSGPVIIKDKDGGTGGKQTKPDGGTGASSTAGGTSNGGSGGGSAVDGGGAPVTTDSGTAGADSSTGTGGAGGKGSGGSGTGGAPACDPTKTGTNPPKCFKCAPTTNDQYLNQCTDSQCTPFDTSRLPDPLPAPTW